jgi:hypothetical protein
VFKPTVMGAEWSIAGVVIEQRELKSEKSKDWRGYVVKVQAPGITFELSVTAEMFRRVGEGENLLFTGGFEEQKTDKGTRLRFIAKDVRQAVAS